MSIPKKDFFTNNEVLFLGYSRNPKSFSRIVYRQFINSGIRVYPVNEKKGTDTEVKVYSLDELPHTPECAYVLLNKENTSDAVKKLKEKGVKKILFQNANTVSKSTLDECNAQGLETAVACPMMILSKGLMHRIHGFFEGRKK